MENTMKLTPELMNEIKDIQVKLSNLKKAGIIAIDHYQPSVHMREESFDVNFPNIEAEPNGTESYPFTKKVWQDGVEYFALYKEV